MKNGRTILVVDDDDDLRDSLCDALEEQGYKPQRMASAKSALKYLRSAEKLPNLILLDLMMPEMNGWQFRDEQLGDPLLAKIPVVVITAADNLGEVPIQASEILLKPLKLQSLLGAIERHLS